MIPIETFRAAPITEAAQGDLLLARRIGFEAFVIGTAPNGQLTGVILEGEHAFEAAPVDDWSSRAGLLVPGPQILVDLEGSRNLDEVPIGSLTLQGSALFLVAKAAGRSIRIQLRGTQEDAPPSVVAFTKWSMVVDDESGEPVTLFEFPRPTQ